MIYKTFAVRILDEGACCRGIGVALLAFLLIAGCEARPGGASAAIPPAQKEVPAPIESAQIVVRESHPPQYALQVVYGLPSGCARFSRVEVARQLTPIEVTVWNSIPADDRVVCTMIYRTAQVSVELGSGFESRRTHAVRVNGERTISFAAQ